MPFSIKSFILLIELLGTAQYCYGSPFVLNPRDDNTTATNSSGVDLGLLAGFISDAATAWEDPADADLPSDYKPPCDWTASFKNLDDLGKSNAPASCKQIYAIDTLSTMLDDAIAKYTDVNNGYDGKFGSYTKYIKEQVPKQLESCMGWPDGKCLRYFDCRFNGDMGDKSGGCPVPDIKPGESSFYTITYTLKDENGLYDELSKSYGIDKSYVKFGDKKDSFSGNSCRPGNDCEPHYHNWLNTLLPADNYEVANPKDIVTEALKGVNDLKLSFQATQLDIHLGILQGSYDDALQVLSMPVFLIGQAVDSMAQAKDIGEDFAEEEKKNLALTIISAVFCVVPFIGEAAAAAAGMATMARMIALIGMAGNAALTVADAVQNPQAAPMAILGMLLNRVPGGSSIRSAKGLEDLGKLRRGFDASSIGDFFKKNDDLLQGAVKACKKQ